MGRFYKTSSANPMDYMYKLPEEMMMNVLNNSETQIDNIYQQSDFLNSALAKVKYLTPDKERVEAITKSYGSEIDNIVKTLGTDVSQWRKYLPAIKDLGRKVDKDFSTGEIGKIQSNYNSYQEYDKYIAEKEKDNKVNPITGSTFRRKSLEGFAGTNYDSKTGTAHSFNGEKPMEDIDLNKWMDEQLKGLKDSGKVTWDAKAGQYIIETENGWEGITQDKILGVLSKSISGDPTLMQYLNQRQRFGLVNDVFDKEGKLTLTETGDDGKQKFKNNVLTNAIQGAMQEHSWIKEKGGIKNMTANPYGIQANNQAHDRQMAAIQNEYRMDQMEAQNQLNKDLADYKNNIDKDLFDYKEANKKTETTTTDAEGNPIKVTNPKVNKVNGSIQINPLAGETTQLDKKKITVGLQTAKQDLAALTTARDKFKPGTNQYNYFNELIYRKEGEVYDYNQLYTKAYNSAKEKVGKGDYDYFVAMRDGQADQVKQKISSLQQQIGSTKNALNDPNSYNKPMSSTIYDGKTFKVVTKGNPQQELGRLQMELAQEQGKLSKYNKLINKFNGTMDSYLKENSVKSGNTNDIVQLTDKQCSFILDAMNTNRTDFDLIEPKTGERTNSVRFNNGLFKKGNALTFEGSDDESNIWKYLQDSGKTLSDVVNIKGITGPGGFGVGSTAVVTFKNLPDVNPNKEYLMTLPRSVETKVASTLPDEDNIKTVKNNILESNRHYVLNKLSGFKDAELQPGQEGPSQELVLDNPLSSGTQLNKYIVTPIGTGSSQPMLKVEYIDNNGNKQLLGGKERDGLFLNSQDLAEGFYPR